MSGMVRLVIIVDFVLRLDFEHVRILEIVAPIKYSTTICSTVECLKVPAEMVTEIWATSG